MEKQDAKKMFHKWNKRIRHNKFLLNINFLLVKVIKRFYFKNERLLARGKDVSKSNHKSILFFTSHKCASTLINNVLEKLTSADGLVPVHFANYLPKAGKDPLFWSESFLKKAFKTKGYYYGAFRMFYDVPDLDKYIILLVLRDPRDVLTSHYFSTLFNHPLARKKTLEDSETLKDLDINEYVQSKMDEFYNVYSEFCEKLLPLKNTLFLKYEDMIVDFGPWVDKIVNHLEIERNESLINEIVSATSFTVKKEDKNSFIRNIKAGDHKNKLSQDTIDILNKRFEPVLKTLGYD